MLYCDKHGRQILSGTTIRCTINGDIEQVHTGDDGGLGILGAVLDNQPPAIHPLCSFAGNESPLGYMLEDFEIVDQLS